MSQRFALVTGAMGGLGTAICRALANDGFKIYANCLPGFGPRDAWLDEQRSAGFDFSAAEADVSDYASCQAMVESIPGPVAVLVNNAGITRDGLFRNMAVDQWNAVINTNLGSMFNVTHLVLPGMVEQGWGRVINVSSVNGVKGQFGQVNYSAAKAGVLGFTRALAQEVARKGVTVNAIAPGYVATDMVMAIKPEVRDQIVGTIPLGRLGKPEEVGALVSYLASDLAGFVTGATVPINGGMHMS